MNVQCVCFVANTTNTFVLVFYSLSLFVATSCLLVHYEHTDCKSHDYARPLKATHRNSFNANTLFDKMFSLDFAM